MIFEHITDVVGDSLPQQDEDLDSAHRQADAHDINTHPMITRGKSGTVKLELHVYNATNIPFGPANVHVAMRYLQWQQAIHAELDALQKNKTWDLIPLLENQRVVGCRWLFKVDKKANGTVDRYKVQLVAKGYAQEAGFGYQDTFSPVAETCTVHSLL
ncbi:uncharacterized mitochondrial protein AtMg00820-like [Gossypium hirsutum]|uniref:Uncharacterized mitochondrial protein AtMg00820-like n=1 Tax=Gossypium hirsutum TaxID=3635 RepID=A0A1U8ISL6_GOSHI|nr:uncharacterized mitochondrial protein AtMg00820-like [Gossypium hirsutum]